MHLRDYFTKNKAGESLLTGVRLEALSGGRRHHFTETCVEKYEARDLITKTDKTITMHTVDGDMLFNIDHPPTRVCLLCGEQLPNEDRDGSNTPQGHPNMGAAARAHMEEKHKGEASPDPQHPLGYKYKKYWGVTPDDSVPTVNPKAKGSILASVTLGA